MKQFFTLSLLLLIAVFAFSKPIDEATAQKVGFAFLGTKTNNTITSLSVGALHLVYAASEKQVFHTEDTKSSAYFYIFNINTDDGFVIVSGDDCAIPVLGYSLAHKFDTARIPTNTLKWFEGYKQEIRYVIENKIPSSSQNTANWEALINSSNILKITMGNSTTSVVVAPLVKTHWDQSPYYNDLCPYDSQYNDKAVTGCVATAMAQIMKYWNYPATGTGFHSYNHNKYGTLAANFGATTYKWGAMPNSVNSSNDAVATLMYHCGVSVDMDYGVSSTGGSSAQTLNVADALKTYFGYDNTVQGLHRSNYDDASWYNILETELKASRPIQYAGTGSGGGHSFVCDGYDGNNFFHFNLGWAGSSDGYFYLNALNPGSLGSGGGTGGFNSNQRAIVGIKPSTITPTYSLQLYNHVTPSASTINYNQAFSITTNIKNSGTGTFNGDYCAGVFDSKNQFAGYVYVKSGATLQGGYHYTNNLLFSNNGMLSMIPGNYNIYMYNRPTGGQWSLINNSGAYTNYANITVTNDNAMALYVPITTTPTTLINGQGVTVNLSIVNNNTTTFTGKYYVGLYNLDGSLAQMIDSVTELDGLKPNYHYTSPYLNFVTTSVTVKPGTYLVAAFFASNGGYKQLIGANNYPNPIKVIVKASDLIADKYEANNTVAQASALSVNFSGNTATTKTTGSNCHVGNDYDFYKINLPAGFNYQIKPRLQDAYSSNNGNTYTLDALFSYSFDGINWSEAFDDTLTNNIAVNNGGTVYFQVAPYFSGNIGTYLLEMGIVKAAITPIVLHSFVAQSTQEGVKLSWSTSSEIGCDYFNIEHSENGVDFVKIGKKNAAGNSTSITNYSFNDLTSFSGINYYRLKQVDNDGKYSYSEIKRVDKSISDQPFVIAPNPATSSTTIYCNGIINNAEISVFDADGKIVLRENFNALQSKPHILNTSNFKVGTYVVSIRTATDSYTQKIVVVK